MNYIQAVRVRKPILILGAVSRASRSALAVLGAVVLLVTLSATAASAAEIKVDDNGAECPTAVFTTIQAAVNAANPGDTIRVCPGTYPEQVEIRKPLIVRGDNLVVVTSPGGGVVPNTSSTFSGFPTAAIILVENTERVTIENITVDGANNGIAGCTPDLIGIYYRNASGTVNFAAVKNIKLAAGLEGCQSGQAISVQTSSGLSSVLTVQNSSIHDYQKTGILANEPGTILTARSNSVMGIGPTDDIAQNGIQVAFGATGNVEANNVINHIYSLCTDATTNCFASAGIIVASDRSDPDAVTKNLRIQNNVVGKNQVGIFIEDGDRNQVTSNRVFDNDVYDGIYVGGNNNTLKTNSVFNSDRAAIFVVGNSNSVKSNTINEAPTGIINGSPSGNNSINSNQFFNVSVTTISAVQPTAPGPAINAKTSAVNSTNGSPTQRR